MVFVDEGIFTSHLEKLLSACVDDATDVHGKRAILRVDLNTIHLKVMDAIGVKMRFDGPLLTKIEKP